MFLLNFLLSVSFAQEAGIHLQALPEHGGISVQLEPLKESKILVAIEGIGKFDNIIMIGKKEERQFGKYSILPYLFKGFSLHQTGRTVKHKKVYRKVFELYLKGSRKPIRMVAVKKKRVNLKSKYEKQARKRLKQKEKILSQIYTECGESLKIGKVKTLREVESLLGIVNLCRSDKDYKEGVASLSKISFRKSKLKNPTFEIKKGQLIIDLVKSDYSPGLVIKNWLENNL